MIKKIISLSLMVGSVFAGDVMYSSKVKPVYLDGSSQKIEGKLLPTNAVEILAEEGDRVKFKITGYQNPVAGNIIYFANGQRIFSLAFSKTAKTNIKIVQVGKDGAWNLVSTEAYTTKGDFEKNVEPMYTKANKLYSDNCSMCHSLHEVNHYTANQWPSLFQSMISRTPIENDDVWMITQYLQKHASDMKK